VRRIHDHIREVDLVGSTQFVQQQAVELVPDARSTPFVQAVPQGHAAAAHLLGKILPRKAGLEHENNPGQADPIRDTRFADSPHVRMFRQDRLDQFPQFVRHQWLAHRVLLDSDAYYFARNIQARQWLFLEALNTVLAALILPNRHEKKGVEVRLALEIIDELEELKTPIMDAVLALRKSFGPIVPI
jgi:hypothetical protein